MIKQWVDTRLGRGKQQGDEYRVDCPFCAARLGREDTKQHLYINLSRPVAHCFRCEWSGHYLSLVMSVEGCTYGEAMSYIKGESRSHIVAEFDQLHSPRGLVQAYEQASQPVGFVPFGNICSRYESNESMAVHNYLVSRGVNRQLIAEKFGYVPGSNRAWVLIDKEWWQGRLIIPGQPKYLSPPWPKGDSLWNGKVLRTERGELIICEGVFSAIMAGSNAIALCGKSATMPQLERIVRYCRADRIAVYFDADAQSQATEFADQLEYAGYDGDVELWVLHSGDPASTSMEPNIVAWDWAGRVASGLS